MDEPRRPKPCICRLCGKEIKKDYPVIWSKVKGERRVLFAHPACYNAETRGASKNER